MLLQGDLQKIFDALYNLGVIDPVLEMDWAKEFSDIEKNPYPLSKLVGVVNQTSGHIQELIAALQQFEKRELSHLAMIVAKELVSYHGERVIH